MSDRTESFDTGDRAADHDDHEELLATYLDRLNRGESIDADQILADHPRSGSALLDDLEAFIGFTSEGVSAETLGTLGDYTLRRQIGRGGMGVVYEAWQGSLDRQVALKVLPVGIAVDDKAFHRFMREAKIAGSSNTITGGEWITVRAMFTFCRMPVDSASHGRSRKSPMSNASASSSIRASVSDLGIR